MLTKKKALRITRELFTWLAEHPDKQKGDWPGWEEYGEMQDDCACCEYTEKHKLRCRDCPIKWGGLYCSTSGSPYLTWIEAKTLEEHTLAALEVAALEVAALAVAAETPRQRKV